MLQIDELEEAEVGEWREDVGFGGVLAEELDGAEAVGVEDVVNIRGEIVADSGGWDSDSRSPLFDQPLDIEKAVVAGGFEVFGELQRCDVARGQGFGADGPDGGDPGKVGSDVPLVGEVVPLARADGSFDLIAGFEGKERRIADEDGGVCLVQHGDGIGWRGNEGGAGIEEFAEEDLGVGERAAGGSVGGDGFYCAEGMGFLNDELDGADFVQGGDRTAGDDGEVRRERGDGDQAEVGAGAEELVGAERWLSVVEGVALG